MDLEGETLRLLGSRGWRGQLESRIGVEKGQRLFHGKGQVLKGVGDVSGQAAAQIVQYQQGALVGVAGVGQDPILGVAAGKLVAQVVDLAGGKLLPGGPALVQELISLASEPGAAAAPDALEEGGVRNRCAFSPLAAPPRP